jgi:hypothetical protein
MKYQILTHSRTLVCFVLASVSILSGCTKNYSELNTDPTRLTSLNSGDIKGLFTNAEYMAMYSGRNSSEYQYTQGLFADQYAQFSATSATFDPTDRFNIIQEWIQEQWQATYTKSLPPIFAIIKETKTPETKALNAIARIWKVWIMHRATDYYGPIPYSQVGTDGTTVKYDAQKDIYLDLFKELKEATDDLKANLGQPSYGAQDVIFNGDNAKWLKFANTLRLRLALRVSDVDPVLAKTNAEAAVAGGTMVNLADDAYLKVSGTNYNGYTRQSGWNEFRMSETMESVLVGWSDPRLSKYWAPGLNTGKYKGIRNGMNVAEIVAPVNDPDNTSGPAKELLPEFNFVTPTTVMYTAEAYFLRAEGAVKGWAMGGVAKDLYEKGIEMSLRTWKITDDAAITSYINGTALPSAPGGYFNTPRLTDIPVKFETAGTTERQTEQILTQKWIALFPEGHEAWASIRRSGYPKLYPVIHSDNPDVDPKKGIRRIPFLNYDKDRNAEAVTAAEALLGGPDKASTKLWWDVRP